LWRDEERRQFLIFVRMQHAMRTTRELPLGRTLPVNFPSARKGM
jgi:hypothetical protein